MTEYALTLPTTDTTKPIFLAGNLLELGTLGGDSESNLAALKDRFLDTEWTSPGYLMVLGLVLSAPATATAIGIANHTFDGTTTISLSVSDDGGSTYTLVGTFLPTPEHTFLETFAPVTGTHWRIDIGGQAGLTIGYLAIGQAIDFERGIYAEVNPAPLAKDTTLMISEGSGGQYVGNRVIRERVSQSVRVDNLTSQWVRLYGGPLALALRDKSAFYGWRLAKYPLDVIYAWSEADAQMTNTGPKSLMDWSIDLRGIET